MLLNRMSRAIVEENYPWLKGHLPADARSFRVSTIDLNTLSLKATVVDVGDYIQPGNRIILFDRNGKPLCMVGWKPGKEKLFQLRKRFPFIWRVTRDVIDPIYGETVETAMDRLGDRSKTLGFILELPTIQEVNAVLHRLPSGVDIKTHLQQRWDALNKKEPLDE